MFYFLRGRHGRDRMVVGFTTTYAICAYQHWCCGFDSCSGRGVHHSGLNFATSLVAMASKDVILRPSFCHRAPNWRPSLKTWTSRNAVPLPFSFSIWTKSWPWLKSRRNISFFNVNFVHFFKHKSDFILIYHVREGYLRKIPVKRRKISQAEWRGIFSLKTGIFRKYPSQTWYICLITPNII